MPDGEPIHRGRAIATDLTAEQLLALATAPKSVTADGVSVTAQSADEIEKLLVLAKRAELAAAAGTRASGIGRAIFQKIILPGHT